MRIAVASFSHETCTFVPQKTTYDLFEDYILRGDEIFKHFQSFPNYIRGFMKVAEEENAKLVGILAAGRTKAVGFTGWITRDAFEKITNEILDRMREAGSFDGVLLALHGAMAVEGIPKPEAEIVRRVRNVVGNIPIMVTLDLHANEDHELAEVADAVFILKTYPHVDSEEIGMIAARCMIKTIRGEFKPVMAFRKPGVVSASIFQATDRPPMKLVYDRCREWEAKGVYCASVAAGYAYADVPDIGASVFVVTNGNRELAEKAAQDISNLIWSLRYEFTKPLPKPKEGVAEVIRLVRKGVKPILIAEHSDRLGDGTHVLKELIEQGAKSFVIGGIADPTALEKLKETYKVGDEVTIKIGGWAHPISGEPIEIKGKLEYLGPVEYTLVGPMGRGRKVQEELIAVINMGEDRHVIISQTLRAPLDDQGFIALGIDPRKKAIIVLKDRVHHRAFWDKIVALDYPIDSPGLGPADLTTLEYHNVPDDAYPIGKKWRRKNK
ncbi:MAG: M81 family metallopeptidase [archaeon GB-1867-005]|nr:M81 family metallopeptidase [Candidatus Culexmicrobium cathedralense]